jgi:hypothetical protein
VLRGKGEQLVEFMRISGRVPGGDGAVAERFLGVGNDPLHVDVDDVAEPFACLAGAERVVVVQQLRFDVGILDVAAFTAEDVAVAALGPGAIIDAQELCGVASFNPRYRCTATCFQRIFQRVA